jgi:hypothetical protein
MITLPSCQIVIAKYHATELDIKFQSSGLNHATEKSIYNAWMKTAMIDNHGAVWLLPDRLAEILRTSKPNARYIQSNIRDEYKRQSANGTYLNYSEVNRILTDIAQHAGSTKREQYADFSESIGRSIRKCGKAQLLRAQTYEAITDEKRKLKSIRIKALKLVADELTLVPLLKTSEFAHIRSCAIYPQFATNWNNGLILNRDTHLIVTQHEINNEHQLLQLCKERNWQTKWYHTYASDLN